jgi:hypothetical protein
MNSSDLLDYALGRLDGATRSRIEHRIARDPALAEQVTRLSRNLHRLLDDGRGDCSLCGSPSPVTPPVAAADRRQPRLEAITV